MENKKLGKYSRIIIPFAAAVVLLTLLMPRMGQFDYLYHKGSKWNYETLVAPFNFPILKTAEQISLEKEKLGNTYVPYFNFSQAVFHNVEQSVRTQFSEDEDVALFLVSSLRPLYQKGVLPDENSVIEGFAGESRDIVFVQRDKRAIKMLRAELNCVTEVCEQMQQQVVALKPVYANDSLLLSSRLSQIIIPNLIFDKQTTDLVHQKSSEFISPTSGVFKAGDVIVSSGEIVTSDIEQILDSYRAEFEQTVGYNGSLWMLWLGNFLLALILTALLFAVIWAIYRTEWSSKRNELFFILFVYMLACIVAFVCTRLPESLSFLMPFPVFALYLLAFLRRRKVLPLYSVILLPVLIFCEGGPALYMIFLAGGFVAVYAFYRFNKGWHQFVTAIFIFIASSIVFLAFEICHGSHGTIDWMRIVYLGIGSLVSILCYQLVYLLEILFNLVSVSRLVDLTDTNSPLLRLLADKAPGTFQHSLSVMNMAEAAGRSIDADVPLLRAAALYHDVGKTDNPLFFVENQIAGIDSHEDLSPKECAQIIIGHVAAGVALAEKYNIPSVIRDCIASHHGTTTTGYFLNTYLNNGGNPDDIDDFRYSGPKPKTREQVILMLCDATEAASRTLQDFSPESVHNFVHELYKQKYKEGQYFDADITMRELQTIEKTIMKYLVNMHHSRIVYPKRKNQIKQ